LISFLGRVKNLLQMIVFAHGKGICEHGRLIACKNFRLLVKGLIESVTQRPA
jgi:hypothetical protein